MRDIKFRAWDKREGLHKMMYLNGFLKYGPGWIDGVGYKFIELDFIPDGFSRFSYDEIELMQFTGLKDKNGKEIYEGDICLKYWSKDVYGDREASIGVIKWVNFGARFTHESNGLKGHKYYCELHENLTNPEYERSFFEVIGNIYENPELIE